ncbi:MAG: 50S rRNA methyltransferase [Sorangiineae bacterium NIC37A_2]|nr:MAG: 50S rRNA methyltransferase [Sorangiineae bacterium NIC37A_2]
MKITILAVGKLKEREVRAIADDYWGRIRRVVRGIELEVKDDAQLRAAVPNADVIVALEVDGKALTSEAFARKLETWGQKGKGEIVFLIGGAEGIPEDVSRKAHERLSLSSMTLPHRLARVLLLEQIYRGLSILRGEPYAREG